MYKPQMAPHEWLWHSTNLKNKLSFLFSVLQYYLPTPGTAISSTFDTVSYQMPSENSDILLFTGSLLSTSKALQFAKNNFPFHYTKLNQPKPFYLNALLADIK